MWQSLRIISHTYDAVSSDVVKCPTSTPFKGNLLAVFPAFLNADWPAPRPSDGEKAKASLDALKLAQESLGREM